jgi:perosamine synthetase
VIIPCFTLVVSANCVILSGARPVLVDADPKTWCIDPDKIEEKITPRTKAIMVVHMYGHPCEMDPIITLAKKHGVAVIEDAAEAHGAEYRGRQVGAIGDVGCFSLYGNKIITSGEGGLVTTNNGEIADRVRLLRNQAFEEPRFVHRFMGFNYRMTNVQAAIALAQCERLDEKVNRKREIARLYSDSLRDEPDLTTPYEAPWAKNVYWMYGILIGQNFGVERDELMRLLHEKGIETRAFFYPMHRQPVYQGEDSRFPDVRGDYPVSDDLGRRGLYLPSGLTLTNEQIREVVGKLRECRR